jgi:hypothetical protein
LSYYKQVQKPTPLGIIFDGTDLNHIGYPLLRSSAPYCFGLDKQKETECWYSYRWDDRDFIAPASAVIDSIKMFFVNTPEQRSCSEYKDWAADNFVLYNVHCYTEDMTVSVHHMTWNESLYRIPKYANYSNELVN